MNAENNTKTFKGIKEQHKSSSTQTESLIIGDKTCNSDHEICDDWAEHFLNLGTPSRTTDLTHNTKSK